MRGCEAIQSRRPREGTANGGRTHEHTERNASTSRAICRFRSDLPGCESPARRSERLALWRHPPLHRTAPPACWKSMTMLCAPRSDRGWCSASADRDVRRCRWRGSVDREQHCVVRGHRKGVAALLTDREEAVPADAEVRWRGSQPAPLDCIGRRIGVDAGQVRPAARFAGEVFRLQSTRRCECQVRDLQTRGEGECRDNGPEKHALCAYSSPTVRRPNCVRCYRIWSVCRALQPSHATRRKVRGFVSSQHYAVSIRSSRTRHSQDRRQTAAGDFARAANSRGRALFATQGRGKQLAKTRRPDGRAR